MSEQPVIYQKRVGTKRETFVGFARQTAGGLRKKDLKRNKRGKIVSIRQSASAKKNNNLVKAGYITKKGVFKLFKKK